MNSPKDRPAPGVQTAETSEMTVDGAAKTPAALRPETSAPRPRPRRRPLPRRIPTFGLSVTSLVATGLAAVTATFAASYLGVAGTVIGAALFSVVTSVGKEVYDKSLRRTGNVVREVVPVTRVVPRASNAPAVTTAPVNADADAAPVLPVAAPRTAEATKWRRIAISAVGVFVAVLAVITGVELIGGRPVSDLVRGDGGSGTSFFGHVTVQTRTRTVPPVAPTMTVTVTPKVVITTPTVTQTAPAQTTTNSAPPAASTTPAPGSATASTPVPTRTPTRVVGTPTPTGSKSP